MATMRRALTAVALVCMLGAVTAKKKHAEAAPAPEEHHAPPRNFHVYPGFPWCGCGIRDPRVTPFTLEFTGLQTFNKSKLNFACFDLSVHNAKLLPTKSKCGNMVIDKIEFKTALSKRFTPDCRLNGFEKAAVWGDAPQGNNVLKITGLDLTVEKVQKAGGKYPICISLCPKCNSLSDMSGLDSEDIVYALFSDDDVHAQCCPTSTTYKPPSPPPPSPPPPSPPPPGEPPCPCHPEPPVPCHPEEPVCYPEPETPCESPVPVADPSFPYCRCKRKADDFNWQLTTLAHTVDAKTKVEHVSLKISEKKSSAGAVKLEIRTGGKCRSSIRNAKVNNKPISAIWENDRPVVKFPGMNLQTGKEYSLDFELVGCTLDELFGYNGQCQYAFFDVTQQGGKCPVHLLAY